MLEFQSNRRPGPHDRSPRNLASRGRSYAELQAEGQAELDAARSAPPPAAGEPARCPHCGGDLAAPARPPGLPPRSPSDASARAAALEATASRLAHQVRDALSEGMWSIWVAPLVLADAHGDQLFFVAPPELAAWTAERFGTLLDRAATHLAERPLRCVVIAGAIAGRSLGDLTGERRPAGD